MTIDPAARATADAAVAAIREAHRHHPKDLYGLGEAARPLLADASLVTRLGYPTADAMLAQEVAGIPPDTLRRGVLLVELVEVGACGPPSEGTSGLALSVPNGRGGHDFKFFDDCTLAELEATLNAAQPPSGTPEPKPAPPEPKPAPPEPKPAPPEPKPAPPEPKPAPPEPKPAPPEPKPAPPEPKPAPPEPKPAPPEPKPAPPQPKPRPPEPKPAPPRRGASPTIGLLALVVIAAAVLWWKVLYRAEPPGMVPQSQAGTADTEWHPLDPRVAHLENGVLALSNTADQPVWWRPSLPENATIDLDVQLDRPDGELTVVAWANGRSPASGYRFRFSVAGTGSGITREDLPPQGPGPAPPPILPGESHHWRLFRKGRQIGWFIDGKAFAGVGDGAPLTGPDHVSLGFQAGLGTVRITHLEVTSVEGALP